MKDRPIIIGHGDIGKIHSQLPIDVDLPIVFVDVKSDTFIEKQLPPMAELQMNALLHEMDCWRDEYTYLKTPQRGVVPPNFYKKRKF